MYVYKNSVLTNKASPTTLLSTAAFNPLNRPLKKTEKKTQVEGGTRSISKVQAVVGDAGCGARV